jgi:hypothetical protein
MHQINSVRHANDTSLSRLPTSRTTSASQLPNTMHQLQASGASTCGHHPVPLPPSPPSITTQLLFGLDLSCRKASKSAAGDMAVSSPDARHWRRSHQVPLTIPNCQMLKRVGGRGRGGGGRGRSGLQAQALHQQVGPAHRAGRRLRGARRCTCQQALVLVSGVTWQVQGGEGPHPGLQTRRRDCPPALVGAGQSAAWARSAGQRPVCPQA